MITPIKRGLVCPGYSNHSGSTRDQWNNLYIAATRNDPGRAPELVICRRQHGTGIWKQIAEFPPVGTKYGYCSLECVGVHLVVIASEREADGSTPLWEWLVPDAVTEF